MHLTMVSVGGGHRHTFGCVLPPSHTPHLMHLTAPNTHSHPTLHSIIHMQLLHMQLLPLL